MRLGELANPDQRLDGLRGNTLEREEACDFFLDLVETFLRVGDFDPPSVGEVDLNTQGGKARRRRQKVFGTVFVLPAEQVE